MGYWFAVAGGAPPEGLAIAPGLTPADALLGPQIYLSWVDGATDEQEPFELDLEVIPVDAAANVGESLIVAVSHAGSAAGEAPCSGDTTGCATAPAAPRGGAALVIALLWARRRSIRAVTTCARPHA